MRCYTGATIVVVKCFPADGPPPGAIYPTVICRFVQLQLSQQRDPPHTTCIFVIAFTMRNIADEDFANTCNLAGMQTHT